MLDVSPLILPRTIRGPGPFFDVVRVVTTAMSMTSNSDSGCASDSDSRSDLQRAASEDSGSSEAAKVKSAKAFKTEMDRLTAERAAEALKNAATVPSASVAPERVQWSKADADRVKRAAQEQFELRESMCKSAAPQRTLGSKKKAKAKAEGAKPKVGKESAMSQMFGPRLMAARPASSSTDGCPVLPQIREVNEVIDKSVDVAKTGPDVAETGPDVAETGPDGAMAETCADGAKTGPDVAMTETCAGEAKARRGEDRAWVSLDSSNSG
jgi:hypothetical protein